MTPKFALTLNPDGISLDQRDGAGARLRRIGSVSLEDPAFSDTLAALRVLGEAAADDMPFATALVLPNSQILYTSIAADGAGAPRDRAAAALDGVTPYPLEDLVFDCRRDGDRLWIAAVARETLEEAEDFASLHRFNPVSFVAAPAVGDFPGEPFFGATGQAAQWMPLGDVPEPGAPDAAPLPAAADSARDSIPPGPSTAFATASPVDQNSHEDPGLTQEDPAWETPAEAGDLPNLAAVPEMPVPPAPSAPDKAASRVTAPPVHGAAPDDGVRLPTEADRADPDGAAEAPADADAVADCEAALSQSGDIVPEAEDTTATSAPTFTSIRGKAGSVVTSVAAPAPSPREGAQVETAQPAVPRQAATPEPDAASLAAAITRAAPSAARATPPKADIDMTVFGARRPEKTRPSRLVAGLGIAAVALLGLAVLWAQVLNGSVDATAPVPEDISASALVEPAAPSRTESPAPAPVPDAVPDIAPDATGIAASAPRLPGVGRDAAPALDTARLEQTDTTAPAPIARAPVPDAAPEPVATGVTAPQPAEDLARSVTNETVGAPAETDAPTTVSATLALLTDPTAAGTPTAGVSDDPLTARAIYAATGIWQRAPERGYLPDEDDLGTLEIASIDPDRIDLDAYALPDLAEAPETAPRLPATPRHPDDTRAYDADGLVVPTEEGVISPGGVLIRAGRPFIVPPRRVAPLAGPPTEAATLSDPGDPLSRFRPRSRPGDLSETTERATLGGRTRSELAAFRPRSRPVSAQQEAEQLDATLRFVAANSAASVETADAPAAEDTGTELSPQEAALATDLASATRRAVPQSPMPRLRPANIAQIADRARRIAEAENRRLQDAADQAVAEAEATRVRQAQQAAQAQEQARARAQAEATAQARAEEAAAQARAKEAAAAAAAASAARSTGPAVPNRYKAKPSGPVSAAVAKQATDKNALALHKVSLIGVYGTSNQRRALVRLPSGKYLKVKVGDRLDGGRVAAIGQSDLRYSKSGRNITLSMPKG